MIAPSFEWRSDAAKAATVTPTLLTIRLLGDFRVTYGETPVTEIKTARLQSLLCYLVLHQDAPQMRRHLAFVLWPDSLDAQARTNLRNLLQKLSRHNQPGDAFTRNESERLKATTVNVSGGRLIL